MHAETCTTCPATQGTAPPLADMARRLADIWPLTLVDGELMRVYTRDDYLTQPGYLDAPQYSECSRDFRPFIPLHLNVEAYTIRDILAALPPAFAGAVHAFRVEQVSADQRTVEIMLYRLELAAAHID